MIEKDSGKDNGKEEDVGHLKESERKRKRELTEREVEINAERA